MKSIVKFFDGLSLVGKIIFALPFLDICWAVYRILKSAIKKNTIGIVLGIILIFCAPFLWIIDIASLLLVKKILWID